MLFTRGGGLCPRGLIDLFEEERKELDNEDHWCRFSDTTRLEKFCCQQYLETLASGGVELVSALGGICLFIGEKFWRT